MAHTVFFSWQTDTPSKGGKNFIEKALSKAIEQLAEEITIDQANRDGLAVDKDTEGVAGTPPIVDTIFRKIDASGAFRADVTFVGKRLDGRPTPNPNVLLEYGWALKSLSYSRITCVMNTHYGEPSDETLPFNMKHLRWPIQYCLSDEADAAKRREVLSELVGKVKAALRAIVQGDVFRAAAPPPLEQPKFEAVPSLDGASRFRRRNAPLGVRELGGFSRDTGQELLLADGPALWLRVMPVLQLRRQWSIAELRQVMSQAGLILYPLGFASSWGNVRGADGFGYVPHPSESPTHVSAVSFAFKSGEVWTTYAGPLGNPMEGTFVNIEGMVTECFLRCVRFMRDGLKIALPYRWLGGIEGTKGKRMQRFAPPGRWYHIPYTGQCVEDVVSETGLLKEGDEVRLALKPFFQRLYDTCGEERGEYMDTPLLALQD
jgi:hypothetical protein